MIKGIKQTFDEAMKIVLCPVKHNPIQTGGGGGCYIQ